MGITYTGLGSQHEKSQNKLSQHANNDSMPNDLLAVTGSEPEAEEDDDETEHGNSAIGAGVILMIWLDESTKTHNDDGSDGS